MSTENPVSLQFAVSTLSCAPSEMPTNTDSFKNIIVPSHVAEAMASRTNELLDHLAPAFGSENMSASLHAGVVVNAEKLVAKLEEAGYPISSYDLSDKKTFASLFGNLSKLGMARMLKQEPDKNIHREPTMQGIAHEVGWFLHNAPSRRLQNKQLEHGLEAIANNKIQIVKTNADKFRSGADKEGLWLRNKLTNYRNETGNNVILAVEINADYFTPDEYFDLIDKLAAENDTKIPVAMDLDTGHIAQSREYNQTLKTTNQIIEDIFTNPQQSRLVAMISLNQFSGGQGAHEKPNVGLVNIPQVAYDYGKVSRESHMLAYPPLALTEFYPKEHSWFMSDEGLLFCQEIKQNFEGQKTT